jgi:phosphoribosylformylglycinamidine synthase
MADTLSRPGGDAAVVRVHGTNKALAITTDCTPRYCYADPYEGGKQAVAEAYRNLCAVGATPLAITNCLNFGNPQRPEIMAQFVGCIEGMAEACRELDFPVVSGNVSLYNESKATGGGSAILPTPAIGGVGLMDDYGKIAQTALASDGLDLVLIGPAGSHLGQSRWMLAGVDAGDAPSVDLALERLNGEFVRNLISEGIAAAVHDISDGGLAVALAEMALAGGRGVKLAPLAQGVTRPAWYFGEDQSRYIVATGNLSALQELAKSNSVTVTLLGQSQDSPSICFDDGSEVSLADLRQASDSFFRDWMEGTGGLDASDLSGN